MISILLGQAILSGENLINSFLDAYLIDKALKKKIPKIIKHGINLGVYLTIAGVVCLIWKIPLLNSVIFFISAFFNRQITFDIPLNLRRGLSPFYVSTDRPPKAWWDRVEVRIFGYDGKTPVVIYSIAWIVTTLINLLV